MAAARASSKEATESSAADENAEALYAREALANQSPGLGALEESAMPARMDISKRPTREQLEQLYVREGLSVRQIGAKLGVSHAFVRKELRRNDIERRPPGLQKSVKLELRTAENYRRLYHDEQKSIRDIARELGVSTDLVHQDMRLFGVGTRPHTLGANELMQREELYVTSEIPATLPPVDTLSMPVRRATDLRVVHRDLDVEFFHKIDDEIKAYALGLIWTDGSIDSKHNTLRIALQERDSVVLEQIQHAMGAAPLNRREPYGKGTQRIVMLKVCSKNIIVDLRRHGLRDNKSDELPKVTAPPRDLLLPFVRGCMDGDGSIFRPDYPTICFYNHNPYLRALISECWERITGKRPPTYAPITEGRPRPRVCEIGERAQAITEALYLRKDVRIYMPRKRDTAALIQEWVRTPRGTRNRKQDNAR